MEVRANAMMKVAGRERIDRKVTGGKISGKKNMR